MLPCATLEMLADRPALHADSQAERAAPPKRRVGQEEVGPPPLPGGSKAVRDAHGDYPNVYETDDFVVKWGSTGGFTAVEAAVVALALEHAWDVEVGEWGYPPPIGADAYKVNVYVAGTGTWAQSYGAAGYYTTDSEGYPYLVLDLGVASDAEQAAETTSHELFHALQDAADTYDYTGQAAWYWEAGAMWAMGEVYPDDPTYAEFVQAWAFLPELSIDAFTYPDGSLGSLHQYGAMLFLRHLTEVAADRDLIRRSWVDAPPGGDPLVVLDGLLAEHGTSIEREYAEFAARGATFDWADGDLYVAEVDQYGGWDSPSSHRPSGTITPSPDGDWHDDAPFPPSTFGANYWALDRMPAKALVEFEGDAGASWHVYAAMEDGDDDVRVEVPIVDGKGSVEVDGFDAEDETWLVAAAVAGPVDDGTVYPYRVRVTSLLDDDTADTADVGDTGEETPRACGCATSPPAGAWLGWTALVAIGVASRRTSSKPRPT